MKDTLPPTAAAIRLGVEVRGVVQGVGFRPFVYRLAHRYHLNGWVRNTSGNVSIEVEGHQADLDGFLEALQNEAPPAARIGQVTSHSLPPQGDIAFSILPSRAQAGEYQPISGDIATCSQCLAEIFDPADRRYLYPFTNCTNCGPRFTIIQDIPYDRPLTTMHKFSMCPQCRAEYEDPLDRRFHAQPNACPVCGPRLQLADAGGKVINENDVLQRAAGLLKQGNIIAVKGMGGFQLACDATDAKAVAGLRQRKRRPGKPFALMLATLEEIKQHCLVSQAEKALLQSAQSPIVLLRWQKENSDIAAGVAQNNKYLGVMLPATPLHHILLRLAGLPLVMTSGNLSEEPICQDNNEAIRRLNGIADYFILHNRDIYSRYDDGVYLVERGQARTLRRARGHAPSPIELPFASRQVLACGAEEKNTFCLTRDKYAFVSQHIGDMDNEETLEHYENTIGLYERLFRIQPEIITHDLHPDYHATRYARKTAAEQGLPAVAIQHHHAHIVSCMADNGVQQPVIGVALDGTGYGSDGHMWGGEFITADAAGFQRLGHLEYIPMPGGDSAVRKPYRMALGYLLTLLGENAPLSDLPIISQVPNKEVKIIKQQLHRGINSPLTSSAGRLFDAVSAMAGIRGEIEYEAQAAIELEMLTPDDLGSFRPYPFTVEDESGMLMVRLKELITAIAGDVIDGQEAATVAGRFHLTVADMITAACGMVRDKTGMQTVALSGGVFQNRRLLNLAADGLDRDGFRVLSHRQVPCNDGGISLGQAVIAHYNQK